MFNPGGLCVEEQKRWYADGSEPRRLLDYPLTRNSKVVDVGAYEGRWFSQLTDYHGFVPYAWLYEPVNRFAQVAARRFQSSPSVLVVNEGLSNATGNATFKVHSVETGPYNKSYLHNENGGDIKEDAIVQMRDVKSVDLRDIDLMSVNIEGGEYDLLERMIETGQVKQVKNLQVQFHALGVDPILRRLSIRECLKDTHEELYCYEFVWESWRRK